MMKNAEGRERESLKIFRAKAKQWFDLDDREYQRLLRSREAFLQQCLENYLLALRESETYNNDALRFCALWLDKSESKTANTAVSRYVNDVPSRKFAPLMNQLSSRLLDVSDDFQSLLTSLVFRICAEHPFHGMYQIFASSKSKGGKDQSSHSRFRAANKLVDRLKNDKDIGPTWIAVHNMNITYVRFAIDKPDSKFKTGAKIPLKKLPTGDRLGKDAETYKLPPPTMKIELRANLDYSDVPSIARFSSEFTLASGVSAPKIVTAVATNGVRYKQLVSYLASLLGIYFTNKPSVQRRKRRSSAGRNHGTGIRASEQSSERSSAYTPTEPGNSNLQGSPVDAERWNHRVRPKHHSSARLLDARTSALFPEGHETQRLPEAYCRCADQVIRTKGQNLPSSYGALSPRDEVLFHGEVQQSR
jgi:hypothetical protein